MVDSCVHPSFKQWVTPISHCSADFKTQHFPDPKSKSYSYDILLTVMVFHLPKSWSIFKINHLQSLAGRLSSRFVCSSQLQTVSHTHFSLSNQVKSPVFALFQISLPSPQILVVSYPQRFVVHNHILKTNCSQSWSFISLNSGLFQDKSLTDISW